MVRIVNYQKRQTEEGKLFFVLEIQRGIEMIFNRIHYGVSCKNHDQKNYFYCFGLKYYFEECSFRISSY
ncbi:hypothetical protein B8T70_17745 [Flavobacterium sp. AJR]|nr:hypothetical protein B8T70_17745 [Flavobacterium sp. AJR]